MTWPTKTDFIDGDVLTAAQVNNIGTNLNLFDPTSATAGQAWVADGAGSGTYTSLATGAFNTLASGSLPSATTLTFSSISSTYKALRIVLAGWSGTGNAELQVRLNNITTSSYSTLYWYGVSTANTQNVFAGTYIPIQNYASTAAGTSTTIIDINAYSETTKPLVTAYTVGSALAGSGWGQGWALGQYQTAAVVNQVDVILSTGNYDAGTYVLYGIK